MSIESVWGVSCHRVGPRPCAVVWVPGVLLRASLDIYSDEGPRYPNSQLWYRLSIPKGRETEPHGPSYPCRIWVPKMRFLGWIVMKSWQNVFLMCLLKPMSLFTYATRCWILLSMFLNQSPSKVGIDIYPKCAGKSLPGSVRSCM